MSKLMLCVTDEDVAMAARFEIFNPVLHKLHQTTDTLWRLCDNGVALEIMAPFRTTQLPSWAVRDWRTNSAPDGHAADGHAHHPVLPCEIELELVPLSSLRNTVFHATVPEADHDAKKSREAGALDNEILQEALLQVLECNGWSDLRAVCPHFFVENAEPYRAIVLPNNSLRCARNWLRSAAELENFGGLRPLNTLDGKSHSMGTVLHLSAELHSPLTGEAVQPIVINFPLRLFEGAA